MKNFRLKEKKIDYYNTFIINADIALEISTILIKYEEIYDISNSSEIEENVHKLENSADQNLHETLNFLAKDFLPPIDREDIVLLANRIDDLIDYLDEIAINFNILSIKFLREDFKKYIEIINKMSILLKQILENFRDKGNYEEINKLIIEINKYEEAGDKIYEKSIKELFENENDSVEIIKWNTIYNGLENCLDSYESVANTIGEIVLKNT